MSHEQAAGAARPTQLKALLQERHLQEHRAFNREYDRVAGLIDRGLVGGGPSKATFYRWLSGDLVKLPYPVHCQVLEKMLPGWAARDLFGPADAATAPLPSSAEPAAIPVAHGMAGVTAVFVSRSEFAHAMPPHRLFDNASQIDAAGLSLNLLCQQYPDRSLRDLLARAQLRLLFLDPDGEAIQRRTAEEHHERGHLEHWTRANINVLRRIRDGLAPETAERVQIRVYDETIRFNIMLIDRKLGIVQPYLPESRGVDSPTFVMQRDGAVDLYDVFSGIFDSLWERGEAS